MKPVVRNQHYIPQTVLRHFADAEEKLFETIFLGDEKKIFPTNVESTMSENFTYEHNDLKQNVVEDYFAAIEDKVGPKIKDVLIMIERIKKGEAVMSDAKELIEELLNVFITFYYRSGALLTEFSSIQKTDKIPLLSKKILNYAYINALADTIKNGYKFAIIESNDEFLLSDQYVSTAALAIKGNFPNVSNRHIGMKETIVLIPLSSRFYIVYWHTDAHFFIHQDTINSLTDEQIQLLNACIVGNSYIKCVAKKKSSIESVIEKYESASPSQIYMGSKSGYMSGYILKKEVFLYDDDRKGFWILQPMNLSDYINLKVNDKCGCGSGKKFKKCHQNAFERIKPTVQNRSRRLPNGFFQIPGTGITELPIDEWGGFSSQN